MTMMERLSDIYQPQLIDEAEALLGVPFFSEDELLDMSPNSETFGLREYLYRSACRLIAEARHAERREALTADTYDAKAWNETWDLTPKKLGAIALSESKRADFLSRQLYFATAIEKYINDHWNEIEERLRDDQLEYIIDIPYAIHRPPRMITLEDESGRRQRYPVRGTTLVAPTGFGKTRLMETLVKMFQPGQRPNYHAAKELARVAIVVPSLVLVEQTARSLQEALPDVRVGQLHQDEFEPHADVAVMTIEMFNAHFVDNTLAGNPIDALIVDEGHRLSEPQFYQKIVKEWRGHTIALTATPAYDARRDIREVTSHTIEKRTIDESMKEGILNDAQVYTFVVDEEVYEKILGEYGLEPNKKVDKIAIREAVDNLVIDFMKPLLEEGRRGIVFCEQGHEAYFARKLAEKLNQTQLSNGAFVKAEAMYSAADNQQEVIKKFHDNELQVITTVDTGREGLDASFDMVIVNCNIISQLRGRQIVGRGTRRSERFPTTVYGQFHIGNLLDTQMVETPFSVEQAFGRNVLSQGKRPQRGDMEEQGDDFDESKILQFPFPMIIQELLEKVDSQPVGETFIGVNRGDRKVTLDSIPLQKILEGRVASEQYAKNKLRKAGYRWQGYYEEIEGVRKLVHHYPPEARDYLHEILPEPEMLTEQQLVDLLDVPLKLLRNVADNKNNPIPGRRVARPKGKPVRSFNKEEIEQLTKRIRAVPGVVPGSKPAKQVARELGVDDKSIWKLAGADPENRYQLRGMLWLTPAEIARAKETFASVPHVEPGDKNIADIAKDTGVERGVVARNITKEEHDAAVTKRYRNARGFLHEGKHWNAAQVAVIEARLEKFKPRKLAAHLIPVSALRKIVAKIGVTPKEEWETHLNKNGFSIEEMRIEGLQTMNKCLSWGAVACLIDNYGKFKGKGSPSIDVGRLPLGTTDLDPDKIAYAQSLQRAFIANAKLENYQQEN